MTDSGHGETADDYEMAPPDHGRQVPLRTRSQSVVGSDAGGMRSFASSLSGVGRGDPRRPRGDGVLLIPPRTSRRSRSSTRCSDLSASASTTTTVERRRAVARAPFSTWAWCTAATTVSQVRPLPIYSGCPTPHRYRPPRPSPASTLHPSPLTMSTTTSPHPRLPRPRHLPAGAMPGERDDRRRVDHPGLGSPAGTWPGPR